MMMVCTATLVVHDARTRCLTLGDGWKPAKLRGYFRLHGMQTSDKPVKKMDHGVGDVQGRCGAANLGGEEAVAASGGDGKGGGPWWRWGAAATVRVADLGSSDGERRQRGLRKRLRWPAEEGSAGEGRRRRVRQARAGEERPGCSGPAGA